MLEDQQILIRAQQLQPFLVIRFSIFAPYTLVNHLPTMPPTDRHKENRSIKLKMEPNLVKVMDISVISLLSRRSILVHTLIAAHIKMQLLTQEQF